MIYQNENFGGAYDFRSGLHEGWQVDAHLHEYSEILYCRQGEGKVTVNGKALTIGRGQLIWIPPNYIHSYDCEGAEVTCAVFSNDFVPLFFRALEGRYFCPSATNMGELCETLSRFHTLKKEDYLVIGGYLQLIGARVLANAQLSEARQTDGALYQKVISYLSEHYTESISLSSVAKTFGYNEKYLSHLLHDLTNMHFSKLIALYRVEHAKHLFETEPQQSVTEVMASSGFSALNTFHRAFKEMTGCTPLEYKKRFKAS